MTWAVWGFDPEPHPAPNDNGVCPSCGEQLDGPRCGMSCGKLHCRWCGHVDRVVGVGDVA